MGVWDWLRTTFNPSARALVRAQKVVADTEAVFGMQVQTMFGSNPPKKGTPEMLQAYSELPWLHAVVRRRAEALASVEWVLYRRTDGGRARMLPGARAGFATRQAAIAPLVKKRRLELVEDAPLVDLLTLKCNPTMTSHALWDLTSKHQDIVGESFWGLRRERGRVTGLWPIVPTSVTKTPTPADPTYSISVSSGKALTPSEKDVLWIRQYDPWNPWGRGVGTARAAAGELETDRYASQTGLARFYNRGSPETVFAFPQVTSREALKEIKTDFRDEHEGSARAGRSHFFGGDVKIQTIAHTMVESQYVQARQLFRDFIIQLYGVPPEILGVLANSNRSTISAAEALFARFCTVPMLERFRTELQAWLVPEFGPDLWLDYVNPVPADADFEKSIMVALPGAFTLNEIRARAGEAPRDDGDVLMLAPGAPRVPVADTPQDVAPSTTTPNKQEADDAVDDA
jgi:HK97 family phage portal protein